MLVLEGSDNLGKTTAAKRIVELGALLASKVASKYEDLRALPIYYAHMSRPNSAFDFHHHYFDMMSAFAVQDRFHLGALVWHQDVMDIDRLRAVEGQLARLGSVVCILYSSDYGWFNNHVLDSMDSGKEEMFDIGTISKGNYTYESMAQGKGDLRPTFDFAFDIKDGQFLNDNQLIQIMHRWYSRLGLVMGMDNQALLEMLNELGQTAHR